MKKKILFSLFLFVVLIVPFSTNAWSDSTGGEGSSGPGGCSNCSYTFHDTESFGVRIGLYKYDGSTITEVKVIDLIYNPDSWSNYNMSYSGHSRPYYTNLNHSVSFSSSGKISFKKLSSLGVSKIEYESSWGPKVADEIVDYFGESTTEIISKVKSVFGVTISTTEFAKYYLVVEPTMIWKSSNDTYTYGTAYEFVDAYYKSNPAEGSFWWSAGKTIRNNMLNAMYELKDSSLMLDSTGKYDYYNFINYYSGKGLVSATSSTLSDSSAVKTAHEDSRDGHGITVLWLSQGISSCTTVCSGKTGDSLLNCAENFCSNDATVTDKESKEDCITNSCNYTYTKLSCGSSSSSNGEDTVCSDDTSSSKKTCQIVNTSYFSYKVECTTNSTVVYPSTLPTTLSIGEGFEYQVKVYGNKTCTVTFDSALWKYNYASSYTDSERQNYLDAITNFNKLSLSNYNYDSSNASITTEIAEKSDGTTTTTTKTLVAETSYYTGSSDVNSTSTSSTIKSYHNGTAKSVSIKKYTTDSSNGTYYNLPSVCISAVDNLSIEEGTVCDNGLGPYNKYYTSIDADTGKNNVSTSVKQTTSGMDVNNTCNYTIETDDDIDCYIDVSTSSGQTGDVLINNEDIKFTLYAVTRSTSTIRYNIGKEAKQFSDSFNNKTTYTISKNSITEPQTVTIYGTVAIDEEHIATCKKEVNIITTNNTCEFTTTENTTKNTTTVTLKTVSDTNAKYYIKDSISNTWLNQQSRTVNTKSNITLYGKVVSSNGSTSYCYVKLEDEDDDGDTCTSLYKPAEYQNIKNYCKNNWETDTANYSSYEDCYNSCTSGKITTCKKKYSCTDTTSIKSYCQTYYADDGYNSVNDCINDCGCTTGLDYYYRTISVNDPFPQRDAGYNWLGYEEYITNDVDDSTTYDSGTPEYEIVLDSKKISKIKSNTADYNSTSGNSAYTDYIRVDSSDTGSYKSYFIHENDPGRGGFYSYFTYIEGTKVNSGG